MMTVSSLSTTRATPRSAHMVWATPPSTGTASVKPTKTTTIHRLIEAAKGQPLSLPGTYDALSAKLASRAGFPASFVSGYAVSAAMLGEPDLGLLMPSDMSRRVSQMSGAAPHLALLVDADTGGGGVLNVRRTVRSLVREGAKGCVLEDQVWPKRPGHMNDLAVTGPDEFAAKIAAARDAIGIDDFFLVARTDARATSAKKGLADAIARANLYLAAGADAAFIEAPRSRFELEEICAKVDGLKMVNMMEGGLTPMMTDQQLGQIGFQMILHPMTGLYAASKAMATAYGHLHKEGSIQDVLGLLHSMQEFDDITGLDEKEEQEMSYYQGVEGRKLVTRVSAPVRSQLRL